MELRDESFVSDVGDVFCFPSSHTKKDKRETSSRLMDFVVLLDVVV